MFARRREKSELMPLFDGLIEFVGGRRGGDDLGSFRAGQPSVIQFQLSWVLFQDREPGRYQRSAQFVENHPGDLDR
jgi:hypothetical protein